MLSGSSLSCKLLLEEYLRCQSGAWRACGGGGRGIGARATHLRLPITYLPPDSQLCCIVTCDAMPHFPV